MSETWFRGQSSVVPPAKTGAFIHDFGDGLYLTDRLDVADQYAKTRVANGGGKPEVLQIEIRLRDLGRVLDLRNDQRWSRYLDEPLSKNDPNLTLRRTVPIRNESYNGVFREFLRRHQIDINQYDAVIGDELVRGGHQVCIRRRNGAPSSIAQRIRARLRPVVPKSSPGGTKIPVPTKSVRPGRVTVKVVPRARLRGALRGVSGGLIGLAIALALAPLQAKASKIWIDAEMKELEPKIEADLLSPANLIEALRIDYEGGKPHANITLKIVVTLWREPDDYSTWYESMPDLQYVGMTIEPSPRNRTGPSRRVRYSSYAERVQDHYVSVEAPLTKDMRTIYRGYRPAIEWYQRQLDPKAAPLTNEQRWQLAMEFAALTIDLSEALRQAR